MPNHSSNNHIVVIRSSDERTFDLCRKLVQLQTSPQWVTSVNLTPFKAALEECYRIAIESEKKWLITVDADMLLIPGSIDLLLDHAEQMPNEYVQLQGKIFDKITGSIRKAGPRIYRIQYLPEALDYSIRSEDKIRPEGSLVSTLGDQGMPSRYISAITAYHDFEQYYDDLYRKAYVHAIKHQKYAGHLIQRSLDNREQDHDFKVIYRAVLDGLEESGQVSIDKTLFREKSKKALQMLNIEEKEPFDNETDPIHILESIQSKQPLENKTPVYFTDQPSRNRTFSHDFFRIIKRDGWIKGSLHGMGIFLEKIGKNLQIHT